MGRFVKGSVVVIPFPFSDLSSSKRRPALVVAELSGDDVICVMITSQQRSGDEYAIPLTNNDLASGQLKLDSFIRPNRIFTADTQIIVSQIGVLTPDKLNEVITTIVDILSPSED